MVFAFCRANVISISQLSNKIQHSNFSSDIIGEQNLLPQNKSLWHEDYFTSDDLEETEDFGSLFFFFSKPLPSLPKDLDKESALGIDLSPEKIAQIPVRCRG